MSIYRSKNVKQGVSLICIAAVMAALVTACGAKKTSSDSAAGSGAGPDSGTMKVTFMLPGYSAQLPDASSPVLKKLTEATHVEVEPIWVPSTSYDDKFNIALASGDLPSLMVVPSKTSSFINAARSGAFWDLTPYLKDYPNLKQANPIVLNNISIDGKVYGIYRSRPLGRYGISYRKDWLDHLGLQPPKTIDDFYHMLKAFTTKDPDGDGKNDTYGLMMTKDNTTLDIIATWFGAPNQWGEDASGKLIPAHLTGEYMDALKFVRKLYEEHLINPDFAVVDPAKLEDTMANGAAGSIVSVLDSSSRIEEKIWTIKPELKNANLMDVVGSVEGPKGLKNLPTSGYAGMIVVPKSKVKTEADLKNVLAFLDKLNDKDMQVLLYNGIEGRHYTLDKDGYVIVSKDETVMGELNSLNQMLMFIPEGKNLLPVQTTSRKKVAEVEKDNEKIVVANPAAPLISSVYAQKGAQLDNIINDARIQYIVGKIDENGFKQAVELWRKSGGDDYIKEMNDLYAKIKK
jgi:putative aldouronate transport system substrate-binding protein